MDTVLSSIVIGLIIISVPLFILFVLVSQRKKDIADKRRVERRREEAREFSTLQQPSSLSKAEEAAFSKLQQILYDLYLIFFEWEYDHEIENHLTSLEKFANNHGEEPIGEICREALTKTYNLLMKRRCFERAEKLAKRWELS